MNEPETFYWPDVREQAVRRFRGDLPRAETEAQIIEAFEARPRSVVNAIDQVASDIDRGSDIRSPWAVLRSKVWGAAGVGKPVTATDEGERERAVMFARRWIITAGLHSDRVDEVLDEVFERGVSDCRFGKSVDLRPFRYDQELRDDLAALWREHRPAGQQLERDELERAAAWKATREAREKFHRLRRAQEETHEPVAETGPPLVVEMEERER